MLWHWSIDVKRFQKENPEAFRLWRLEHLINYGIQEGEKISKKELKAAWPKIKERLDPDKRKTIEYLAWGKKWHPEPGLLPDRSNFWQWYWKIRTSSSVSI